MPELPEVETIKNELLPHVTGRLIIGVAVDDERLIQPYSISEFCRKLLGRRVAGLSRRGKYLSFQLSGGKVLIVHLRMTGSLVINTEEERQYCRAVLQFDNGDELAFIDRRRLGIMRLVDSEGEVIKRLGTEPLTVDFTAAILAEQLKGRQAPIKAVLLDQAVVAGVGNMYADESLFASKIHPMKKAGELSPREVKNLHRSIVAVLQSAIARKGASVDTYKRPGGEQGNAHDEFNVAHRRGKACRVCGTTIQRIAIRNRGSYFCPNCQKL
jgi:formamidopyrimidine-DNA glycosylase